MAKTGNSNAVVSILAFVGSLLFLWVLWGAWGAWVSGTQTSGLGILAALVFGAGAISAVGLFFLSLASFAWGWMDEMVDGLKMSSKMAGIATVAISASAWSNMGASSALVGTNWLYAAVLGFVLSWIAIAMAKMAMKK